MRQTIDFAPIIDAIKLGASHKPREAVVTNRSRLRTVLGLMAARRQEALTLAVPLLHAAPFHECNSKIAIADGGNQAAKTFHVALETARALCNCDPYGKYPRGGLAIFIGYDEDHLADPMYKKLFKPGEFKLIRDEQTGRLRSVRPDPNNQLRLDPYDVAYREKWIDSPPLIPERLVRRMAWEDRGKEIPRVTELATDWRILWRASGGKPPQGVQAAVVWADEELKHSNLWVNEMLPRLIKTGGRFLWSATPREGGPELFELRRKADAGSPYVKAFTFVIDQNPYMSEEERQAFRALLTSDSEVAVRYFGEYAIVGRLVYPTYSPETIHGCEPFEIPSDWCRYAVVDPATNNCATLLAAVDPDEEHLWVYGGWVMQRAEQTAWAYQLQERERGVQFEALIMDERAGKQHQYATSRNTAQQFAAALTEVGLQPRSFGPMGGFFPGSPDLKARTIALRNLLTIRSEGPFLNTPRLQVMRGIFPELDKQIKAAVSDPRDVDKRQKFDDQACDVLDCLEYLANFDPRYYAPERTDTQTVSFAVRDFDKTFGRNRVGSDHIARLG